MRLRAFCLTLVPTIVISIAASLPAQAQRARVFVSVTGNDANPCTAGSPCKTFQAAHDAVLPGGEISVLDTGGYGTLIISKAVSIVAVGVQASIAIPSGTNGITIKAGSTDMVSLRGLTLDGTGVGQAGIVFNSGQSLTVEDCVARNMTEFGLVMFATGTTLQTLSVSNSSFNDNGTGGIQIGTGGSGAVTASIDRTTLYGNSTTGLFADGHNGTGALKVAVTDSVASNNGFGGFFAFSTAGHSSTHLSLTHVQAAGNTVGINANDATIWLAQSSLTENSLSVFQIANGGIIESYGDNYLAADNGGPSGSLSSVARQ